LVSVDNAAELVEGYTKSEKMAWRWGGKEGVSWREGEQGGRVYFEGQSAFAPLS